MSHYRMFDYQSYLNHWIWRQVIRPMVIERAFGRCERCGYVSTEVNHIGGKYPPWGAYEVVGEYLEAICHGCHCKEHGKND